MKVKMQDALEQLLSSAGTVSHSTLRFPKVDEVAASDFRLEIEDVYRRLGGILPSLPLNLRSWDMEFDSIAIELDEYLHFNRYRGLTLKFPIYERLPHFPLESYNRYCLEHEGRCLAAGSFGARWTNKSTEAQFGLASQPRDLSGNGSPRWKQRAFYDFVKDISPLLIEVKVVRVAVWDVLEVGEQSTTVGEMLTALIQRRATPISGEVMITALVDLITERAAD